MRTISRITLGLFLLFTGTGHLTFLRREFTAQVPDWVPLSKDTVVLASGVVEVLLGLALMLLVRHQRRVGIIAALFFIAIFPGNVSQWLNQDPSFGLDTDGKRLARLFVQPLFIAWAVWSTRTSPRKRPSTTRQTSA